METTLPLLGFHHSIVRAIDAHVMRSSCNSAGEKTRPTVMSGENAAMQAVKLSEFELNPRIFKVSPSNLEVIQRPC
jgi:hypothetical protein